MLATRRTASIAIRRLGLVEYGEAWELQRRLLEERQQGLIPDTLVLLEHPPTYTFGRRATNDHLLLSEEELQQRGVATFWVDRGGDVTYHGPGQIVGYPILDLRSHGLDVHQYLRALEQVLIETVGAFGIVGERDSAYTGVWVNGAKIAAIGVKISRGVTSHGFALNVNTDLTYFDGIVPCGIPDRPVTSMERVLERQVPLPEVEAVVEAAFGRVFS